MTHDRPATPRYEADEQYHDWVQGRPSGYGPTYERDAAVMTILDVSTDTSRILSIVSFLFFLGNILIIAAKPGLTPQRVYDNAYSIAFFGGLIVVFALVSQVLSYFTVKHEKMMKTKEQK